MYYNPDNQPNYQYMNISKSISVPKFSKQSTDISEPNNTTENIDMKIINANKNYPASTREWNNSIYTYNKPTLKSTPQSSVLAMKIITSYLNTYNSNIEKKIRKSKLVHKQRKFSSHKIYVANGEFKHTNDKVIIILYTYNRQKYNYLSILKNRYIFCKKTRKNLNKRFYLIKHRSLNYLKKLDLNKYILIKDINKHNKIKNMYENKTIYINYYLIKFYKKWVKKSMQKIKFYLYFRQLLHINESKYNYTYLQILKNYVEKIYSKKVEFNLINLKYHYLNSDIFAESITLKITKNRKKLLKYLNRLIRKVKIYKKDFDKYVYKNKNKLNINDYIENLFNDKPRSGEDCLKKVALQEIKYKRVSGIKLQASGRLTRRYTASRSVKKFKYKGNLLNIDSSYKGISTVLLKGNLRPNLQFTKLKSKTRIGSFGIKSWISGN